MAYTVPTTDKSISSVKNAVLAAGVSLLFLYLVTHHPLRSTSSFRSWPPTCSTAKRSSATESSKNYWRPREFFTSSSSQVSSSPHSYVFHLPALLLRSALRHPELDHSNPRHLAPHLLHRWQDLQVEKRVVLHVLRLSPLHLDLDHPRPDRWIRVVQPAIRQLRLKLIV